MLLQHRRFILLLRLSWSTYLQHLQVVQLWRLSCVPFSNVCGARSTRDVGRAQQTRDDPGRPCRVCQAQYTCWSHGVAAAAPHWGPSALDTMKKKCSTASIRIHLFLTIKACPASHGFTSCLNLLTTSVRCDGALNVLVLPSVCRTWCPSGT